MNSVSDLRSWPKSVFNRCWQQEALQGAVGLRIRARIPGVRILSGGNDVHYPSGSLCLQNTTRHLPYRQAGTPYVSRATTCSYISDFRGGFCHLFLTDTQNIPKRHLALAGMGEARFSLIFVGAMAFSRAKLRSVMGAVLLSTQP